MKEIKRTDEQKEALLNAYAHLEVFSSQSNSRKSVFLNLIKSSRKNLSLAHKFYASLSDHEIEKRWAIRSWESGAWNCFEQLEGCSLKYLLKSIDPRLWAKKEQLNLELLFDEGKNHLMTSLGEYSFEEIPRMYEHLVNGNWEDFISIDELRCFKDARLKYDHDHDHGIEYDLVDFNPDINIGKMAVLKAQPKEKDFLNNSYFIAQLIQALIWYKEFLNQVILERISFTPDDDDEEEDEEDDGDLNEQSSSPSGSETKCADPNSIEHQRQLFIEFTKSVLIIWPNIKTADVCRNCFEEMDYFNSRDKKIINDLLIKAGVKKSKKGEHAITFEWKDKYPRSQWERVFNKQNKQ